MASFAKSKQLRNGISAYGQAVKKMQGGILRKFKQLIESVGIMAGAKRLKRSVIA